MISTKTTRVHLAVHPHRGGRPDNAIALRRLRVALVSLLTGKAPTRTAVQWHDVTRQDPRSKVPCEKERAMIHNAIREGCTTPEYVIRYRLAQMHDDLDQFDEAPLMEELLYVQMMREQHEALHAQARAHAFPSTSLEMEAVRETEEATVVQRAYCWMKREGRSLLHLPH